MTTAMKLDGRTERNSSLAPIRLSQERQPPRGERVEPGRRLTPRAQATYRLRAKTAESEVPIEPMAELPSHMRPELSFQGLILALQRYWADYGCVILQPYDME